MKKIYLTTLFVLGYFLLFSQDLYIRRDLTNTSILKFAQDYKIKEFRIFTETKFLSNDTLDRQKLLQTLNTEIPDINDNGFLVLNWEAKGMDVLAHQKDDGMFNFFVDQYISALKFVKKYRPNLKCAYYTIPFPKFNDNDQTYMTKINRLGSIIRYQDFVSPSLYVLYPTDLSKNLDFTKRNTEYALELAKTYNKPVYAFVWHRVHPLDKAEAWQLLPALTFRATIQQVLNARFKKKQVDGIFWWHSENNNYSKMATVAEMNRVSNVNTYNYTLFQKYYNSIKDLFESK